jgi:hypothetical protein
MTLWHDSLNAVAFLGESLHASGAPLAQDTPRVRSPVPQVCEHSDQSDVQTQPDFSEHRLVPFGLGAAPARQSSSIPVWQATDRFCSPTPHRLEHSDHWPVTHLQPDVSWHGSSPTGGSPKLL